MVGRKSKSAKYYSKNPAARKKKAATDKKINARPAQKKKRAESNAKRREATKKGSNIKGKDYDHATNSFTSVKANRGRKGEGGRKKK
jgi:hypothetical protein